MNQFKNNFQNEYEMERKTFRYAFVLKPSFDFSPLKKYCDKIIYACEGYGGPPDQIKAELETSLAEFDEGKDVLIPTGSALINLLAGTILQRRLADLDQIRPSFAMGIWFREDSKDGEWVSGDYVFWRIHTDGKTESYEIIQQ